MNKTNYTRDEILDIQAKLKLGLELTNYGTQELKYVMEPVGSAIYKNSYDNKVSKPTKTKPYDRLQKITCELCGRTISRNNKAVHERTRYHMAYANMNKKIRDILLDK